MNEDLFKTQEIPVRAVQVEDAKAKIHLIEPLIRSAVDLYSVYEMKLQELENSKDLPAESVTLLRFELDQVMEELMDIKIRLLQNDALVKDWKNGIVNFVSIRKFEPVFICYRMGESDIRYYYKFSEDYCHRRPIDFK